MIWKSHQTQEFREMNNGISEIHAIIQTMNEIMNLEFKNLTVF